MGNVCLWTVGEHWEDRQTHPATRNTADYGSWKEGTPSLKSYNMHHTLYCLYILNVNTQFTKHYATYVLRIIFCVPIMHHFQELDHMILNMWQLICPPSHSFICFVVCHLLTSVPQRQKSNVTAPNHHHVWHTDVLLMSKSLTPHMKNRV